MDKKSPRRPKRTWRKDSRGSEGSKKREDKSEKRGNKRQRSFERDKPLPPTYKGYDDLPSSTDSPKDERSPPSPIVVEVNSPMSSPRTGDNPYSGGWEAVDIGAESDGLTSQKDLSSLDVHDHFWDELQRTSTLEGMPRGFLHYQRKTAVQSDGKPKGFLTFINKGDLPPPHTKMSPEKHDDSPVVRLRKNRSIFSFFENFSDRRRQKRMTAAMSSQFSVSDFHFPPAVPRSLGRLSEYDMESPPNSPPISASCLDLSAIRRLGGILPSNARECDALYHGHVAPASDPLAHRSSDRLYSPAIEPLDEKREVPVSSAPLLDMNVRESEHEYPSLRDTRKLPMADDDEDLEHNKLESSYPPLMDSLGSAEDIIKPATPTFSGSLGARDWNAEFQYLMENIFEDEAALYQMRDLCRNFAEVVKNVGRIIIQELFLEPHERTIPPITGTIGGVAGGEKYVYTPERIFFKFAVDDRGLYGGTENIMKAAGQELKALMELMDCRVEGVHFPLMVLVDYRGYRLIAMPLLPVGPDTLVYGSADGGRTIQTSSSEMNVRMQLIASILNLAPHNVWSLDRTTCSTIHGPVDIEGHQGRDDRFYILDAARLFPPTIPVAGLRGCHLYRLLRAELVKNNPVPLCSDAYSTWDIDNLVNFNQQVAEATHRLEQEIIPLFADSLQARFEGQQIDMEAISEYKLLNRAMHRRGINLRMTGMVRQHITDHDTQQFVLVEIVARVTKKILAGRMRQLRTSKDSAFCVLVADYFNLLFGTGTQTNDYWRITIKNSLLKRFAYALFDDEKDKLYDLRESLCMRALFIRLRFLCGLEFCEEVLDLINEYDPDMEDFFESEEESGSLFLPEHILDMRAEERSIHQIDFAEGTILSRRAAHTNDSGAEELFALADERFQATIDRKPDDFRALHNWALSLLYRANRKSGEEATQLYERAITRIEACFVLNPKDPIAFRIWGNILSEQALRCATTEERIILYRQAIHKYSQSFQHDTDSFELLYNWANTLLHLSRTTKADECTRLLTESAQRYSMATALVDFTQGDEYRKAFRNWGVVLCKLGRLQRSYEEAEQYFAEAQDKFMASLSQTSADGEVYFNLGNLHYHRARSAASEGQYKPAFQQLAAAGDRYLASIDRHTGYTLDAITNWGKVLNLQAHLSELDHPEGYSLVAAVEAYLNVLYSTVTDDENALVVSLKPVLGLAKASNSLISERAVQCLRQLCDHPAVQEEANRALRIAERSLPAEAMREDRQASPKLLAPSDKHSSVSVFLQKMKATHVTSLIQRGSKATDPSLVDFQRLSDLSPRASSCTVCLKGTTKLFVLKVRRVNRAATENPASPPTSIPPTALDEGEDPVDSSSPKADFQSRMMRILQGRMPFMARILYSYQKDCHYYFIQEYINEDYSLHKLRQNGTFTPHSEKTHLSRTLSQVVRDLAQHSVPTKRYLRSASFQAPGPSLGSSCPGSKMFENRLPRQTRLDSLPLCLSEEHLQCVMPLGREPLPEPIARFYLAEIIILFSRLHLLGFVYGNLTPTTVHLDGDGHVRLTRFLFLLDGVSLDEDVTLTTTAPEVMAGGIYCKAADWWSVGALLHEFLTSSMPQDGADYTMDCSEAARSLIDGLLEVEPDKRLGSGGIQEIKSHEFFQDFDWSLAESRKMAPPVHFGRDISACSTPRSAPEEEDDVFRAPTIVAQMQKTDFHQHSLVAPPLVNESSA